MSSYHNNQFNPNHLIDQYSYEDGDYYAESDAQYQEAPHHRGQTYQNQPPQQNTLPHRPTVQQTGRYQQNNRAQNYTGARLTTNTPSGPAGARASSNTFGGPAGAGGGVGLSQHNPARATSSTSGRPVGAFQNATPTAAAAAAANQVTGGLTRPPAPGQRRPGIGAYPGQLYPGMEMLQIPPFPAGPLINAPIVDGSEFVKQLWEQENTALGTHMGAKWMNAVLMDLQWYVYLMGEWLKGKFAVLSPDGETLHKQIIKKAEEQIKKNLQAIVLDGQRAPMEQYKTTEFDPAIQDLQKRLTKLQTALNNRVPADSPSIKRVSLALTELLRLVNARNDRFKKDIAGVQTAQAGLDKQFGKFGFRLDAVEDRMGAIEAGTADAAAVNQLIEATTRAFARVGVELFPTAPNDFAGPPSIAEADRLQLETLRTENTQLTRKVHELSKELELMKTQSDAYKMMLEYSLSDNDRLMNTVYPQDLNRGAGGAVSADPPQPQVGKNEMEGKREGDEAEKDGEDDRKKGDGAS